MARVTQYPVLGQETLVWVHRRPEPGRSTAISCVGWLADPARTAFEAWPNSGREPAYCSTT